MEDPEGAEPRRREVYESEVVRSVGLVEEEDTGAPKGQSAAFIPGSYLTDQIYTEGPEPGMVRSSGGTDRKAVGEWEPEASEKLRKERRSYVAASALAEKAASVKHKVVAATRKEVPESVPSPEGVGKGKQDKGISLREYLAEKLSPGEEDRAVGESGVSRMACKGAMAKDGRSERNVKQGRGVVRMIKSAATSLLGGGGGGASRCSWGGRSTGNRSKQREL